MGPLGLRGFAPLAWQQAGLHYTHGLMVTAVGECNWENTRHIRQIPAGGRGRFASILKHINLLFPFSKTEENTF